MSKLKSLSDNVEVSAWHLLFPPEPPELSVVICTRNRAESLRRCLDHFERVVCPFEWELVVVDNGSTDETASLLQARQLHSTPPLEIVSEPVAGVSLARNAGLRRARGGIICITDDDCYPAPDLLSAWREVFRDPEIGFGGGRVELFDPDDADVVTKTDLVPQRLAPRSLIFPGTVHGCCMAFRREVIAAIGPFDTYLGPGTAQKAAEDSEYLQRASACGFADLYSPEPMVWHHHGRKAADVPAATDGYERGEGAFYVCVLLRSRHIFVGAIRAVLREGGPVLLAKVCYWSVRRQTFRRLRNLAGGPGGISASRLTGRSNRCGCRISGPSRLGWRGNDPNGACRRQSSRSSSSRCFPYRPRGRPVSTPDYRAGCAMKRRIEFRRQPKHLFHHFREGRSRVADQDRLRVSK